MTFPQLTLVSWGNVDYRTSVFCNSLKNQFTEFTSNPDSCHHFTKIVFQFPISRVGDG